MLRFVVSFFALVSFCGVVFADDLPACGPGLDEAVRSAGREEAQQSVRLNYLASFLMEIEYDYDAGRIEEAEFLEQMEQGEAEFPVFQARFDAAKAEHERLKEVQAACPSQ